MIHNYFVIDMRKDGVDVFRCNIDDRERKIFVMESWHGKTESDLMYWLKEQKEEIRDKSYKVIITLGSDYARTTHEQVSLMRNNPEEIISDSELESVVTQLMWKYDNQPVPFGYVLQAIHIRSMTIDNHLATDPLGLMGKNIVISLSKTIIKENLYTELRDHIPADALLYISEAGSTCAYIVLRTLIANQGKKGVKPYITMLIQGDASFVFSYTGESIHHIGTLSWGEKNITSVLFAYLGIDHFASQDVMNLYIQGSVSKKMEKNIDTFIKEEISILSAAIEGFLQQEKCADIYISASFPFPIKKISLKKKYRATVLNSDTLVQKLGYALNWNQREEKIPLPSIAVLFEVSDIPFYSEQNKIISRRLRWTTHKKKAVA